MMIYIYYIIILLKVSLSISTCKEGENNCILCHPITKVCLKCDKVAIIDRGKIIYYGTLEDLKKKYKRKDLESLFMEVIKGE